MPILQTHNQLSSSMWLTGVLICCLLLWFCVPYCTWQAGSQSNKCNSINRILESNSAAKTSCHIPNKGCEYRNHQHRYPEGSPTIKIICVSKILKKINEKGRVGQCRNLYWSRLLAATSWHSSHFAYNMYI